MDKKTPEKEYAKAVSQALQSCCVALHQASDPERTLMLVSAGALYRKTRGKKVVRLKEGKIVEEKGGDET